MPLPATWTLITVTGTYTQRDGEPAVGRVVFVSPRVVVVAGEIIVPRSVVGDLDENGQVSVQLPSTDDPEITPTGWTWEVREEIRGLEREPWSIEVAYDGGPIDLSEATPVVPVAEVAAYLTQDAGDTRYLQESSNLSDLDNAATARTNLGLGNVDNTSDAAKPVSTATQTALDAKQTVDADLTAIAGLTPSNDDVIQRKAGAWTNRTPGQLKTDLALAKGDVGLGNVDNTSDVDKPVSTATQTALDGKQTADGDLTAIAALTPSNDDVVQRKAGAWTNRTMAQVKTDLALVKGDVGLGNVDNTSDAAKPVSTATQTALDGKQTGDADLTAIAALTPSNDDLIQRKAGAWTNRTLAELKTDLGLYFTVEFASMSTSPADATTYYFGFPYDVSFANPTAVRRQKVIPVACTLRAAAITIVATAGATTEASSFSARINDTTDVLLSNAVTMDQSLQTFSATGLSQAIAAGDKIEIKVVTPTWVTNPTTVRASVTLFFN